MAKSKNRKNHAKKLVGYRQDLSHKKNQENKRNKVFMDSVMEMVEKQKAGQTDGVISPITKEDLAE